MVDEMDAKLVRRNPPAFGAGRNRLLQVGVKIDLLTFALKTNNV
jgi:hypothetical protein